MTSDPSAPFAPFPSDVEPRVPVHDTAHAHGDPVHAEVETHIDPRVAEAVHGVRDRFGAGGLRDLITLASYELDLAEQAAVALSPSNLGADVTGPDGAPDGSV